MKTSLYFLFLALMTLLLAPLPANPGQENAIRRVHDPCIIKEGNSYYVFCTGPGVPIRKSPDLVHWSVAGRVFKENVPDWLVKEILGSRSLWAPDISYSNGRFHLYYSVSSYGKNRSIIALASTKTLDASSKDYAWKDEGKVLESNPADNYNAIDPNVIWYPQDRSALIFGSFWSGIKLVFLDAATGKPKPDAEIFSLARRPSPDAIEAPFLIHHGSYYYLFVSFDYCCRGVNSTYNIRVGRSREITGPYLDREGKPMLEGGGTVVLATKGSVVGPGHCAVLQDNGKDYLAHHYYDGDNFGIAALQIRPLLWTNADWPEAGSPLHE